MENTSPSPAHTPAPWRVSRSTNPHVYDGEDHLVILADPERSAGQIIADLETLPEADANARLIAAAPDLLEALETLNEWSIDSRDDDFPYPVVEAAITKATGR